MKNLKFRVIILIIFTLCISVGAFAQDAKNDTAKQKYQRIEITTFAVKEGIDFPAGYTKSLPIAIAEKLKKLGRFKEVMIVDDQKTDVSAGTLRLTGTIIKFDPGSKAKRYIVGLGTGKTKIIANIKITDTTTGEVLVEEIVDGIVTGGFLGGSSSGATKGVAKEIASIIKKKL